MQLTSAAESEVAKRVAQTLASIRAEAARAGLTRQQLAERADIPYGQLCRRLSGRVPLSIDELHRISTALGVEPDLLMPAASDRQSA